MHKRAWLKVIKNTVCLVLSVIMDKMTESELCSIDEAHSIFDDFEPRPFVHVDILSKGKSALEHAKLIRTMRKMYKFCAD
jgi:hypothetical protein